MKTESPDKYLKSNHIKLNKTQVNKEYGKYVIKITTTNNKRCVIQKESLKNRISRLENAMVELKHVNN